MADKGEVWAALVKKHGLQVCVRLAESAATEAPAQEMAEVQQQSRPSTVLPCCCRWPQDTPYNQLATWQFVDFVFTYPASWFSTVNKLRRTGFHAMCIDSDAMFASLFQRLREEKVIP